MTGIAFVGQQRSLEISRRTSFVAGTYCSHILVSSSHLVLLVIFLTSTTPSRTIFCDNAEDLTGAFNKLRTFFVQIRNVLTDHLEPQSRQRWLEQLFLINIFLFFFLPHDITNHDRPEAYITTLHCILHCDSCSQRIASTTNTAHIRPFHGSGTCTKKRTDEQANEHDTTSGYNRSMGVTMQITTALRSGWEALGRC